jgi:hypothetical protein
VVEGVEFDKETEPASTLLSHLYFFISLFLAFCEERKVAVAMALSFVSLTHTSHCMIE